MADTVIRDEDVRRRVKLAQEFLDPGMSGTGALDA
jgi:hypothetical protein